MYRFGAVVRTRLWESGNKKRYVPVFVPEVERSVGSDDLWLCCKVCGDDLMLSDGLNTAQNNSESEYVLQSTSTSPITNRYPTHSHFIVIIPIHYLSGDTGSTFCWIQMDAFHLKRIFKLNICTQGIALLTQ